MKKLLITLLAFTSFSYMNAQEDGIRFGAKAGLNIANLTGDGADEVDSKTGFHIGGVVEIPISEAFAIQPELLFSSQGAKSEFSDEFRNAESTQTLNYINIPIMAKYYVTKGLSLQAGPQIGILVSSNFESEGSFDNGSEIESFEIEDDSTDGISTIDFGLNFGAGYQLDAGLFFDARYNLGLSNINDEGDAEIQNGVFQISVGYKF